MKNSSYSKVVWSLSAALIAATSAGSAAAAIDVTVGPSPLGGTTTQHEFQADYQTWFVADLSDPIVPAPINVTVAAGAGAWTKALLPGADFPELQPGSTYLLQELLRIGAAGLDNWSEEILTPEWEWADGAIFDVASSEPLAGLEVSLAAARVNFRFDPLAVDTDIFLVKTLRYLGPEGGTLSLISVQQIAAPIPEPQTLALLAAGLLGIALTRLRQRARRSPPAAR